MSGKKQPERHLKKKSQLLGENFLVEHSVSQFAHFWIENFWNNHCRKMLNGLGGHQLKLAVPGLIPGTKVMLSLGLKPPI